MTEKSTTEDEPSADDADEEAKKDGVIDPVLLSLLVCPLTKKPLKFDREACELVSEQAKLAYPVRGGIAIMLPSEARQIDADVSGGTP